MAAIRSGAATAALLLAACGPKALSLPPDAVDRAATCGIVAAADARTRVEVSKPLPLEAQGRILHYALLAASAGGAFDAEAAKSVTRRMGELQDRVTKGKWRELAPACAAAFPATSAKAVTLPAAKLDAQLQCAELSDFLETALASQEGYGNEIFEWARIRRAVNDRLGGALRARVGGSAEAQRQEKRKALARAAALGAPVAVMAQCAKRFGPSG
ncbi:MAG: hypothetical protein JOZ90_04540 [Alphaproteobacteria bacterium]|nr:hypothetical protein [Alphaproteobacteria bacterium]MBV9373270.1 hypothetical protein [Alphaproteobacteria bacterium]MBV9900349.1 hypothetical protein [Alphaproteobacteria bacterium]